MEQNERTNAIDKVEKEARTKPMTTEELFEMVCSILKEKNLMPDILDYWLADWHAVPIRTYEYDLRNNLGYGASEGIYLDLWIEYYEEEKKQCKGLGTFKTLGSNREAMQIMAKLLADFLVEESDYVNSHLDDFTWTGADVHAIGTDGKRVGWGYSCRSMEKALEKKDELLQKYPGVVVRNNATRQETEYRNN